MLTQPISNKSVNYGGHTMVRTFLFAIAISLTAMGFATAQDIIITDVDFDTSDPEFGFGFSGNGNADVPITYTSDGVGLVGEGGVFSIDDNGNGPFTSGFAGGGFAGSLIDLATAGFTAGAVTLEQLDTLVIAADISFSGGLVNFLRIQPDNGGFNDQILLIDDAILQANAGAGFVNYEFVVADLDDDEKNDFLSVLNGGNETAVALQFSFAQSENGDFNAGEFIAFDNILVTSVSAIPEPGSLGILAFAGVVGALRRKRA